ncbi:MAG: hypothetical protein ABJQ71_08745 [Roseibium sp.]
MSTVMNEKRLPCIRLEYEIDEAPEKVWRAISIPEYCERWLPRSDLAHLEPACFQPGSSVSYRMREGQPPHLESTVTFRIFPGQSGGTILRIIHVLDDVKRADWDRDAANCNLQAVMMAA